jgi:hypothetical protein
MMHLQPETAPSSPLPTEKRSVLLAICPVWDYVYKLVKAAEG